MIHISNIFRAKVYFDGIMTAFVNLTINFIDLVDDLRSSPDYLSKNHGFTIGFLDVNALHLCLIKIIYTILQSRVIYYRVIY